MKLHRILSVCLLHCFLLLGFSSSSEARLQVGIFPFQSVSNDLSSKDLKALSKQLMEHIELKGKFSLIKQYPLVGGTAPAGSSSDSMEAKEKKALAPVRSLLVDGIRLIEAQKFEASIKKLKAVVKQGGVRNIKWPGSLKLVFRAYGLLALAYFQTGDMDKGEIWIKNLAVLQPKNLTPEIKKYRRLRFLYKRYTRRIHSQTGSLEIRGPANTQLYLDGKLRGRLPLTINMIPVGYHFIQARKQGSQYWGQAILVKKGKSSVDVTLEPLLKKKASPVDKARNEFITSLQILNIQHRGFKKAAKVICLHTGSQVIITGQIKKSSSQIYLLSPVRIDCQKNKVEQKDPLQMGAENVDLTQILSTGKLDKVIGPPKERKKPIIDRDPPPKRTPEKPRDPVTNPNNKAAPIYKKWWFWTGIGVVAGGGVAAAIVLTQPPKVSVKVTWK